MSKKYNENVTGSNPVIPTIKTFPWCNVQHGLLEVGLGEWNKRFQVPTEINII